MPDKTRKNSELLTRAIDSAFAYFMDPISGQERCGTLGVTRVSGDPNIIKKRIAKGNFDFSSEKDVHTVIGVIKHLIDPIEGRGATLLSLSDEQRNSLQEILRMGRKDELAQKQKLEATKAFLADLKATNPQAYASMQKLLTVMNAIVEQQKQRPKETQLTEKGVAVSIGLSLVRALGMEINVSSLFGAKKAQQGVALAECLMQAFKSEQLSAVVSMLPQPDVDLVKTKQDRTSSRTVISRSLSDRLSAIESQLNGRPPIIGKQQEHAAIPAKAEKQDARGMFCSFLRKIPGLRSMISDSGSEPGSEPVKKKGNSPNN